MQQTAPEEEFFAHAAQHGYKLSDTYRDILRTYWLPRARAPHARLGEFVASLFEDDALLSRRLSRHCFTEYAGARVIGVVARDYCADHPGLKAALQTHAEDEYRHSAIFWALSRKLGDSQMALEDFDPIAADGLDFLEEFGGSLGRFMCDANFGEFRNFLIVRALLHEAQRWQHKKGPLLARVMRSIYRDELRHLSYSAEYLSAFLETGEATRRYVDQLTRMNAKAIDDYINVDRLQAA